MSGTHKLILFGAGLVGRQILPKYQRRYDIVAFTDNDKAKHGTYVSGVEIVPVHKIDEFNYDYIVITSTASAQIYDQLLTIGIPKDKILEASEIQNPKYPWDVVLFLSACILFLCFMIWFISGLSG